MQLLPKLCDLSAILLLQDGAEGATGNVENGGKPKRKRKRDSHQQELNKQAQHRYRCATHSMLLVCNSHNNLMLHSLLCVPWWADTRLSACAWVQYRCKIYAPVHSQNLGKSMCLNHS